MSRWFGVVALLVGLGVAAGYLYWAHAKPTTTLAVGQTGPVVALARGLLNETQDHKYDRALRLSIRMFQERTGIALGIVLKDQLPPLTTIEAYAASVFKQTRLGENTGGKGLLMVWVERDRLFKIEVSYDLEGVFPDLLCKRLEEGARTFMLAQSAFARRDFITELIVTMGLHYLDYQASGKVAEMIVPEATLGYGLSQYFSGGGGVVGRGYAATLEQVQREIVPMPADLAQDMQPHASADAVVQRYLASLGKGIGAPALPLLTEGSQYFRLEKPHAPGYLQRIHAYYQKAMPYQLLQKGDLAVATFKPGAPVLPILLRRNEKGLWLVDEARAWAYFHLDEDGSSTPKYADSPYAFAWHASQTSQARTVYLDRARTPAIPALPYSVKKSLQQAELEIANDPKRVDGYVRAAELLQFEMYWIEAAAPLYEKVLELAPQRDDIRWRLIDIYTNVTDIDALERQYRALLRYAPSDTLAQHYFKWFKSMYD